MSSVFCFCRGNEQCEKSRQSTMGSLLTNRRIDLTVHSATARMSEGKAGANGALRVEFSTFLGLHGAPHKLGKLASWGVYCKFYLGEGSAQAGGTNFQGSLHQALRLSSAQTPGQAEPVFTRPLVLRFRLRACAPINRQSPQRASSRLERGALWRSLAQPCARKPRNVSV